MPYSEKSSNVDTYQRHKARFVELLDAHVGTPLLQLNIPGFAIWDIPTTTLSHLTHIGVHNAYGMHLIGILFQCCPSLESLSIHSVRDRQESEELASALAAQPDAAPRLTHLKVHIFGVDYATMAKKIAPFLRAKKRLRCLDWFERQTDVTKLGPFLSVLTSLPHLEALGFAISCDVSTVLGSGMLNRYIPKHLKALRLLLAPNAAASSRDTHLDVSINTLVCPVGARGIDCI